MVAMKAVGVVSPPPKNIFIDIEKKLDIKNLYFYQN